MTPEQLWDNHSELILAEYISKRMMSRLDFLAALAEYGDAVRAENAEPVAWMNPENGVVIDARQKQQIGEGSGYPKFSIPLYTAIDRARSANDKG